MEIFAIGEAKLRQHVGYFNMGEASLHPKCGSFPEVISSLDKTASYAREVGGGRMSEVLELGPGERWFVARVFAHQENRAQLNLHRLGFRSFVPKVRRTVRHARSIREIPKPLFPGYVFIAINLSNQRWRSVNGTFGIASLIMGAEQPRAVPSGVVEALAASINSSGAVFVEEDALEIGQKVRILSGPFAQTLCRLAQLDDRARSRASRDHGHGSCSAT